MTRDLVLLHSPLVGPSTWPAVASLLTDAGRRVVVPDLSAALLTGPPHRPALAALVTDALAGSGPVTLAGHSSAGPLLPGLAAALGDRVGALIYVDAQLPYPGKSWWESAPQDLVKHLDGLARDGLLPPWNEWFPPGAVESLLPDPVVRASFLAELRAVPLSYFTEPTSAAVWAGPAGYLLLSDGYREDADAAVALGLPVTETITHHLAMLTDPAAVASALLHLDAQLPA